jgi:hypothetical protein
MASSSRLRARISKSRLLFFFPVLLTAGLAGCGSASRKERTLPELLELRRINDARLQEEGEQIVSRAIDRAKAEYDEFKAGRRSEPPVLDILIVSGGGDWGAFGAGFLKGWGRVPPGPMARPEFDLVTGVSTGALIAPFAFIGTEDAIDRVVHLYRNPQTDWVKQRWPLYFLPNNISFAEVPGLEREMREQLGPDMVQQLVEAGKDGRGLVVNTTNVDDGGMRVWDVIAESRRAKETGDADRVHRILLASAGIPAAFPFREIDDELFVDGGVTGNILYGGRIRDEDSAAATWKQRYPDAPPLKTRYWVIFNNQLRPLPQNTKPNWPAIVARSLEMGTRSATVTALRHLHTKAEISRLKHGAEVEVRIASVPGDWSPPKPGVFIKETMNELTDIGERMGADPSSWRLDPP